MELSSLELKKLLTFQEGTYKARKTKRPALKKFVDFLLHKINNLYTRIEVFFVLHNVKNG